MAERPHLHAVASGAGPDPPSTLFQQLCTDYPALPRRVVGEVLNRVYSAPGSEGPVDATAADAAARALLDATCARAEEAARRTRRRDRVSATVTALPHVEGPRVAGGTDLRQALEPAHDQRVPSRVERLAEAIEARARARGASTGLNLLCEAAAEHLGLTAAAISVPEGLLSAQTVGVAGPLARPLEERQVILGEGPSTDGLRFGTPVLVDDLMDHQQQARWPIYAPTATEEGIRAQFVIPMQVGAARFGIFALYLNRPGGLWPVELSDARVFAELALGWLIDDVSGHAWSVELRTRTPFLDDRAEIHQATGMASVQLGVDLSTALVRLRAEAFTQDRLLSEVAATVVDRTFRFRPDDDDGLKVEQSP